jgi:hypothetical protein
MEADMNHGKKLGLVVCVFLGLSLFLSLPSAQSAEATANAPIMVASQEATIPLTANVVTGASESPYCPYWLTFKLAAVALYREKNKSQVVLGDWSSPQGVFAKVGAGDLNLGWAPGMDTSIMLQNPTFGIELRYLGLAQWDESASDYNSPPFPDEYVNVGAKSKSRLNNAELNLHWWPCANDRYSLLAGFRWFQLTDRLSAYAYDQGGIFWNYMQGSLKSENNLYGGQVGVEGLLLGKRDKGFSIDGGVKAGVFQNNIRNHESGYEEGYNPFGGFYGDGGSDSWSRSKTAFLGEVNLNANYAFTKNIAMTVGYMFLYVNKVAVPVNDYASTQSVIFHGGRLGLNVAF